MKKYSKEFKQEVVNYYIDNNVGYTTTAKHFNLPSEVTVLNWVRRYKAQGDKGLEKNPSSSYSGDFKNEVVNYMHMNGLSYIETAIHFNLGCNTIVRDWEKIYLKEGPEGLYTRKKYDKNAHKKKKVAKKKRLPKPKKREVLIKEINNLTAENDRLKRENEYLKTYIKSKETKATKKTSKTSDKKKIIR